MQDPVDPDNSFDPNNHVLERVPEKIIIPTSPLPSPATALPNNFITPSAPVAPASVYPTETFTVPTLEKYTAEHEREAQRSKSAVGPISLKHKSVLILGILGVISTLVSIFRTYQLNSKLESFQLTADELNRYHSQAAIVYALNVVGLIIWVYLLFSTSRSGVSLVLKILLVLELISVFGAFFGIARGGGIGLLIDGIVLLYTFVTLNIVRSHRAIR